MPRKPTSAKSGVDAKIAPELQRQLQTTPADSPVRAHFTLTTPPGKKWRDAENTRETVSRIVGEASKASNATPERLNVRGSTQSFSISAPAGFVRELTRSDQIAKAFSSRNSEEMVIRPFGPTKIVELPDLTEDVTADATEHAPERASSGVRKHTTHKAAKKGLKKASKAPNKTARKISKKAARKTAPRTVKRMR